MDKYIKTEVSRAEISITIFLTSQMNGRNSPDTIAMGESERKL